MVARYLAELTIGSPVDAVCAVRSKELKDTRDGETFLAVELSDRTGTLRAIQFRPPRESAEIPVGAVVHVVGRVTSYRGRRRITVDSLHPAETWDASDLIATSPVPQDESVGALRSLVASVTEVPLRTLLLVAFGDKGFLEAFRFCPATATGHHAYLGGLIEHTVAVARGCDAVAAHHPHVHRDLLVTAALLHDVGCTETIRSDSVIDVTEQGRLLGHAMRGVLAIEALGAKARLDRALLLQLQHIVASHHTDPGARCETTPTTVEALVLQSVDALDVTVSEVASATSGAARVGACWTGADNALNREMRVPRAVA